MARTGENIYKRKDGRWEGRCIVAYDESGKAKYKYVYAKTYKAVKNKLYSVLSQRNAEISIPNISSSKRKFESILDEWLSRKRISVKESTYIRYKNSIENHIKPRLGRYNVAEINNIVIENFVSELLTIGKINAQGGLSPKSVTDILIIVKEVFDFAQANGFATACNFDNIQMKRPSREMRVLSCSEMHQLIIVLLTDTDRCKLGVLLSLFTGIRIGELCALQWDNISLLEKTVKIDKTMQRLQTETEEAVVNSKTKIHISEPKSFASIRIIPLPDFIIELLVNHQGTKKGYFLTGDTKQFIEPRTLQNRFKSYLKEADIDDANFHSLRHTFATRCIESGFDVKTLSEILGHSSVKITLDKYVHSTMEQKRANMNKLKLPQLGYSPSK